MIRISTWMLAVVVAALTVSGLGAQQTTSAPMLLESAKQKMTIEGDLRGAIGIFEDVVKRFAKSDRLATASALLGIGECYEKLGDPQATKYFEQLVSQYADQPAQAAAARSRLSGGPPKRLCETCGDNLGSVSPDGRFFATVMPYLAGGERAGDVGVLDLSNNRLTALQVEGSGKGAQGASMFPVVSPDSKHVAYSWSTASGIGLRIAPRDDGSKARTLPNPNGYTIVMPLDWGAPGILLHGTKADGKSELVLVSPSDGLQRVVKPIGFDFRIGPHTASLSPDGRFMAYERFATPQTAPLNARQGLNLDRQIHVLAIDGSGDAAITTGAGRKGWPTWSPDGRFLLYLSNVAGPGDLWATPMRDGRPNGEPVLVRKQLGNDVELLGISRSGVIYYYEGVPGVSKTTVLPVGSGAQRPAGPRQSVIGDRPAWSPDGTKLAVSRARGNAVDVIIHTLASGDEKVYQHDGILTFPFIWMPDGSGLLVQVRESANSQYWYRLDLATSEFRRVVQQRGNPAFWTHQNVRTLSADGRTLYFGTYTNQTNQELDRITALDLSTGAYRDVVRLPGDKDTWPRSGQDFVLSASPDGRSLAVMYRNPKAGLTHLATVGVDGQGYREIAAPFQAANLRNKLTWSRDGRWIYLTTKIGGADDDMHRVIRVPAAGGTPEPIGLEQDGLEAFDVSPDGTRIAYSTLRPEGWGMLLWSLDVSWLTKTPR